MNNFGHLGSFLENAKITLFFEPLNSNQSL